MKGRFLRVSGFFGRFRFFSPVECYAFANCERLKGYALGFIEEIYRINISVCKNLYNNFGNDCEF